MRRRELITGLLASAGSVDRPAWGAPASRALSLRQLIDGSRVVADVEVERRESVWAEVFGCQRVVTFWRLRALEPIFGRLAVDAEVVTLGGSVGDVLQWVPHEARFRHGARYLVFLHEGPLQRLWVAGMLQGAFEVAARGARLYVSVSPEQSEFRGSDGSAVARLADVELAAARRVIAGARDS